MRRSPSSPLTSRLMTAGLWCFALQMEKYLTHSLLMVRIAQPYFSVYSICVGERERVRLDTRDHGYTLFCVNTCGFDTDVLCSHVAVDTIQSAQYS